MTEDQIRSRVEVIAHAERDGGGLDRRLAVTGGSVEQWSNSTPLLTDINRRLALRALYA